MAITGPAGCTRNTATWCTARHASRAAAARPAPRRVGCGAQFERPPRRAAARGGPVAAARHAPTAPVHPSARAGRQQRDRGHAASVPRRAAPRRGAPRRPRRRRRPPPGRPEAAARRDDADAEHQDGASHGAEPRSGGASAYTATPPASSAPQKRARPRGVARRRATAHGTVGRAPGGDTRVDWASWRSVPTSEDRKRGGGRSARRRPRSAARTLDLEAVGLVLLALGIALLLVLLPASRPARSACGCGRTWRIRSVGAPGWPWPFLLLGGLFLLRRSPPRWPRVLLGYVIAAVGGWSLLMLVAPAEAGTWGTALRGSLAGAAGVLAFVPAVLLVVGRRAHARLAPDTILRTLLRPRDPGLRAVTRAAWQARVRARARAAFRADVARVRRELRELDRDLAALRRCTPAAASSTAGARACSRPWSRCATPTPPRSTPRAPTSPPGARPWATSPATGPASSGTSCGPRVRPPRQGHERRGEASRTGRATTGRARRALRWTGAGGAWRRALRSVSAAEVVRKALALDLTGLVDRHRRLTRERDLAEAGLADARPRDLARSR